MSLFFQIIREELHSINKVCAKKYNEKIYFGKHPVNFYFAPKPFNKFKADAIYDLKNNRWIKQSESLPSEEIEQLIERCKDVKEFNEILYEYLKLKKMLEKNLDYEEIINQAFKVYHLFENIREIRRNDFEKKKHEDIPSANWNKSNIVFKILEHYGLDKLSTLLASYFAKHQRAGNGK